MSELTEQERKKIYEEEKARLEAREKIQSKSSKKTTGYLISLAGSFMIVIGLFLPWTKLGLIKVNAFDKIGDATLFLALGVIAGILALYGLSSKKNVSIGIVLSGLVTGGFLAFDYFSLKEHVNSIVVLGRRAEIGMGFWITAIGVFITILGSAMLSESKKKK